MNKKEVKTSALEIIVRILEETAFIFSDPMEERERPEGKEWAPQGVSLVFSGAVNGKLRMWVGEGFARFAAANMLGIGEDEEKASEKGVDALKEILNIIVGNLLTDVYGDNELFDLGIPEGADVSELDNDMRDENGIWLQAEEHPVLFVIDVEE